MVRLIASAAAVLLLGAAAAWADEKGAVVEVSHNKLDPVEITVKAGESVTFRNIVEMPGGHSLEADDGSWASPALDKDGEWSRSFEEPGTYAYKIKEHPSAEGKIIVE